MGMADVGPKVGDTFRSHWSLFDYGDYFHGVISHTAIYGETRIEALRLMRVRMLAMLGEVEDEIANGGE